VTITLLCGIPEVVIGVTEELAHGEGLDRKPIGLGTTVPRPTDFSCQVPLHVLVLNCHMGQISASWITTEEVYS